MTKKGKKNDSPPRCFPSLPRYDLASPLPILHQQKLMGPRITQDITMELGHGTCMFAAIGPSWLMQWRWSESRKDFFENEFGVNLEEEEEGECETNSSSCDDINEIESCDIGELLGEIKSSSERLPQTSTNAPCSNVVEKYGFTTVYYENQMKALKKQSKEKLFQPCFNQEENYLLNQVQSETPKHFCGRPKREIRNPAQFKLYFRFRCFF
ncbi:hypothetical protein LguiB_035020 [Lonicera macranthoides]